MERLLVVDDDPEIVRLLSRFLGRQGYDVATAPDGEAAMALLRKDAFALVVTDIAMPKWDGLDLLRGAKARDPEIEVIILTGAGILAHAITALREGAYDYLLKPLERLEQLGEVVQRALERRRLRQENRRLLVELGEANQHLEEKVASRTADLEEANRHLGEALRVKAEFLSKMSHELRTPLNLILGFAGLLQEGIGGSLTSKQAHYLDRIQAGGQRLLDLVTDILDLSRVEAGTSRLSLDPVPLGAVFQEVQELVAIPATQKRLEIITTLDPPLFLVVADRRKLVQILTNLLGNAVKFTPERGRISIAARSVSGVRPASSSGETGQGSGQESQSPTPDTQPPDPSPCLEITVADTGIGIAANYLERIFEPFHQVDGSETRSSGGAGVGLALVRTLVELHGGRVWAESEGLGRGTCFIVRLPRLQPPRPKRILLVEDDAVLQDAVATALGSVGYVVASVESGIQALTALQADTPDLLILDISLPDLDGWEILTGVRRTEATRTLPVLVLTGLEDVHASQALAMGADEFLAKPVSPRILVETVARLLRARAAASAGVGKGPVGAEEGNERGNGD